MLISPAATFAASATQDAYDDVDTVTQDDGGTEDDTTPSDDTTSETATPAPSATSTSSLPFTGLEAGLIAVAGLGLAGTGAALRRAAREQE